MPERFQHRFPILVLLLAVVVGVGTVACDSGGDNNSTSDVQNEFSFDVTEVSESDDASATGRKAQTTLDGFSFFYEGSAPDSDEEIFVVYFTQENALNDASSSEGLFGFMARESLRPGSGAYALVPFESGGDGREIQSDFGMILFDNVGNFGSEGGSLSWYLVDAGSVTLTTSSNDRVEGTINAEALNLTVEGQVSDSTRVTIEGTFTARNGESFVGLSP